MNYESIHPNYIIKQKLYVNKNTAFIVLPDTNLKIYNEIYNTNFLLSNCIGLVCPNKIFTIGKKKFNGKAHYLEVKKYLTATLDERVKKKIKVLANLVIKSEELNSHKNSKFFFYDASMWSQAFAYLLEHFSERGATKLLFNEMQELFQKIKKMYPTFDVDVLFLIKDQKGNFYNIFQNLRILIKAEDLKQLKFFDNYALISDCQEVIFPILNREKSETHIIIPNLQKMEKFIEIDQMSQQISNTTAIAPSEENKEIVKSEEEKTQPETEKEASAADTIINKPKPSLFTNLVQDLMTVKLKADSDKTSDKFKITVNQAELSRVLRSYRIDDPDIIANVKSALDTYIRVNKQKPTRDEAEHIVLKAIYYSLYGTDEVPEEILEKPNILFKKLKEIDTYKVPLDIPDYPSAPINPKNLIDLKYTTGQHRQKFEFETAIHENIKKLFGSLESVSNQYPIKVKKIDYEIKDNNSDRYINYKVTLQNISGGKKEPYVVELKVPAPVNDKYFKIHGNHYIMSSQQFLRPITKTDKNEVRMISNYGIVRVGLANVKFNPSDIESICEYMRIRYPKLIKNLTEDQCEFSDGSTIYFSGEDVYKSETDYVVVDDDTNKLYNKKTKQDINQKRFEYIYNIILNKIETVNPEDTLTKTKKAKPYIWIYLGAIKIPLIVYMWGQKGLLSALNSFSINYEIKDQADNTKISIPTKDNKFLVITPDPNNIKQQFIINGLSGIKFKEPIQDLDNPEEIYQWIVDNCGTRSLDLIANLTANFVDPVTKELLEFENQPTNLVSLASTTAVDQLLNKKIDSLSDLKIYRARLSEVILNSVYKQIRMAQNTYRMSVLTGDDNAAVFLNPDYVIMNLLTEAGVLQNAEPVSPVNEIMLSSRVIKTGKGGIPSRRSSKKEHRNIHPSQYGIIGACSTPEYIDVGLTVHHTLTPVIVNKYGSYGVKDISNLSGWQVLALDEAMTPFQNQVDSDRLFLARTHANQVIPIDNREPPIVASGAEMIVPQIASPRFVQKAARDGVVTEVVPNKTMTVKYTNGETQVFDIIPRLSRTKRGSYIMLDMQTLPVGTKIKANQPIAFTKNFDSNGVYCAGKNVFTAVMNYLGFNHEDSYVISKELAENTTSSVVEEVSIIVPPNTSIVNMIKENHTNVEIGDTLVEFTYENSVQDYIDSLESGMDVNEVEEDSNVKEDMYSAGDNTIKRVSTLNGEIVDIKVYINNKSTVDRSLLNFHKKLTNEQQEVIDKLQKTIKDPDQKLKAIDNMDLSFMTVGGHKYKGANFQGVRIVYYIKHPKPLREGDKISNRYGAKGVISKVLDPAPKGEITPRIDVFISPISILGRKNIAMLKELYLGKVFYYANLKLKELAADPKITNDKLTKFITDLYNITGPEKVAKDVAKRLETYSPTQLRNDIKNDKFKLFIIVEPFEDVPFENVKTAAEFLDIPLEEKVYIPELDQWTETPVPVGVSYYLFLEHFSDVYANVRGTGKFVGLTRQPTKRKSQGGGQSIARLDVYAFLTYDANNILSELLGPRSDEHESKRKLYNTIIETGELPSIEITKTGGTQDVFNLYVTALGLEIV